MKDINKINDKNEIDLESLNDFLLEKGDDYLEALLIFKKYINVNYSNQYIKDYIIEQNLIYNLPAELYNNYDFWYKAVSYQASNIGKVPVNLIDYPLCEKAVSQSGYYLRDIPKKFIDYPLCKKAVSNYSMALADVPKNIDNYYELVNIAFQNNKFIFHDLEEYEDIDIDKYISQIIKDFPEDKEFLERYLRKEWLLREYISKKVRKLLKESNELLDNKLQEKSDENEIDLESLNDFLLEKGDDYLDVLLQVEGFKEIDINDEKTINKIIISYPKSIPEILWYKENFIKKAISLNKNLLESAPKKIWDNKKIRETVVYLNSQFLKYIPENLRDYALCEIAVSNDFPRDGYASCLFYVPKNLRDYALCEKAVSKNALAMSYVPKNLIDYSLCDKAVSQRGWALGSAPEHLIDYTLCEKAVSNYGLALEYVPEFLKDYPLCEIAVSQNKEAIKYIKDYTILKQIKEKFKLQEHISKEVRKLLKETLFTKKKLL
jgi:hypothetical protein